MELAVVVPAYNEAEIIEHVVVEWLTELERIGGHLYVVNDGSRDATGELLDRLAARHPRLRVIHQPNGGHGAAVLRGYRQALEDGAAWVFQVDSDGQFHAADLWLLWNERDKAPVILGHRLHRQDPLHRKVISKAASALGLGLLGIWVIDPNVPFRLMRADVLSSLLADLPQVMLTPNLQLSLRAAQRGVPIVRRPVRHEPRLTGKVSILGWKLVKFCGKASLEIIRAATGPGAR